MCNAYRIGKSNSQPSSDSATDREIAAAIEHLPSPIVRRGGTGVVVALDADHLKPATMRWGFARPFSNAINNTRSDKLDAPIWQDSLAHRRCLVPISEFHEWRHHPGGAKQAYRFLRPDRGWMWVAAIYEHHAELGPCYSTITTEPPEWMRPIHDRMIAVLDHSPALAFLHGETPSFHPYQGKLVAEPCPSPLKNQSTSQPELF